jgi:glutaredoxin
MQPDVSFLEGHDLAVFSASWCGDCRRLKRFFDTTGIAFREVDIDVDPAQAVRLERETGKRAIPYLLVDERAWVRGYHKEHPVRLDPRLLLEELRNVVDWSAADSAGSA